MAGNLKPGPLPLTPDLVAKLAGDRPGFGKGITHIPIEGTVTLRQAQDNREPRWCDGCGLGDECCCPGVGAHG